MTKPLIQDVSSEDVDETFVADAWLIVAWNIERSLIDSGATPGVDYDRRDLYQMAQPFVLEKWKKEDLKFITGMTITPDKTH